MKREHFKDLELKHLDTFVHHCTSLIARKWLETNSV